ncbi:hypothetical protein V8G54_019471 [Vigna mungo]|uniref:Pectin acetylesterase n=1 Tax=Vigna mungo TaxID=3915 RepID=A0AAQ3NAP6_VIGMU
MPHSSSSSSPVSTISNLRIRALILWSSKNYAIAAFVFLLLFSLTLFSHLDSRSRSHSRYPSHPRSTLVPLTLLRNANRTRALCLDGSAPGYHFQSGFGSGSRNWLLHIEALHLSRISSNINVDFFNWNKVKIRYCDGASFAGHPESESRSELLFRGQVIWEATMDELLSIGLSKAKQVVLS